MIQVTDIKYPFVEIIADHELGTPISCVHRHIGTGKNGIVCRAERCTFRRLTPKEKQELALILISDPNA